MAHSVFFLGEFCFSLNLSGPGKCKTKAGSMGLDYVRRDQTVPGADRLSAGPCCKRRRGSLLGEEEEPGSSERSYKTRQGNNRAPCAGVHCCNAAGGVPHRRFSWSAAICTVPSFFAASWKGRATGTSEITTSVVENAGSSFLRKKASGFFRALKLLVLHRNTDSRNTTGLDIWN